MALAAVAPTAAFAHGTLLRTEPAPQSVVARAPARIVLHFNQEITPVRGGTQVTGPGGVSATAGEPRQAADDVRALVIPLAPGLARGDYTVRWRAASTDGHLIAGAFAIGVGAGRRPPQLATTTGSTVDSGLLVARFLYFIGLLVLVGTAFGRLVVLQPSIRSLTPELHAGVEQLERTSSAVLSFGAVALIVVGGWAAVVRQGTEIAGVSFWTPLTGGGALVPPIGATRFGHEFGNGINAATVLFVLLMCSYAMRRWRALLLPISIAAVAAGGWALVGPGLAGHAGDPGRGWLAIGVDALHLAGASVWIGGLAYLLFVVAPTTASLPPDERGRVRLEVAQRFSRLALASVVVISTTGLARALWEVGAVSQIWTTAYGRTLLIKTALLGVVLLLGYRNRRALGDFAALRRRVGIELALLVTLTAAVSLLTDLPPSNTAQPTTRSQGTAARVQQSSPGVARPAALRPKRPPSTRPGAR